MPAATTKLELLTVARNEFEKLNTLVSDIDADVAMEKDSDGTSIKDTVAHRAHWIGLFIGWYTDGMAGKEVFFPAEGYKWNDLKRYNADLRSTQRELDWDTARSWLVDANQQLVSFLESLSDNDLYGAPMSGANNKWTPGRWAEAAGPSHYRSAAKYIRARMRALANRPAPC